MVDDPLVVGSSAERGYARIWGSVVTSVPGLVTGARWNRVRAEAEIAASFGPFVGSFGQHVVSEPTTLRTPVDPSQTRTYTTLETLVDDRESVDQ